MKPVNAIPFPFNLIRALKAESIKLKRLFRRRPQLASYLFHDSFL